MHNNSFLDARRLMPPCCISTLKMISLMQPLPVPGRKSRDLRRPMGPDKAGSAQKLILPRRRRLPHDEMGQCIAMAECGVPAPGSYSLAWRRHNPIISSMHSI